MSLPRVLCVDDEPHVIAAIAVHLGRTYEVTTAVSGMQGLDLLRARGPFAVVVSDMLMPGMDGATFLERVRELAPDTARVLLTGQTGTAAAIAAVNQGQIFRFLVKPCPPVELRKAVDAAAELHRVLTAERVLLEQTLHGSIKALVDVLALAKPSSFGRAMRIKKVVSELAERLRWRERWQVEVAAMLSQLGSVTLPDETVEKVGRGHALTADEQAMVGRLPAVTEQLLANIPRLEVVRGMLVGAPRAYRAVDDTAAPERQLVARGAHLLRIAIDFDTLETQGHARAFAVATMEGRGETYDPGMMEALASLYGGEVAGARVRELPLSAIREGMVFADDVRLESGTLLAARGYEVTRSFVERARNFRPKFVREPIRVIVPEKA